MVENSQYIIRNKTRRQKVDLFIFENLACSVCMVSTLLWTPQAHGKVDLIHSVTYSVEIQNARRIPNE